MLLALNDRGMPLPDQAFMLAPGFDANLDNPRNRSVERLDPMLDIDRLLPVVYAWATGPIDRALVNQPAKTPTAEGMKRMAHVQLPCSHRPEHPRGFTASMGARSHENMISLAMRPVMPRHKIILRLSKRAAEQLWWCRGRVLDAWQRSKRVG